MTATPMAATVRYFDVGTTAVYWLTTISDVTAPTRSELNAGVDLTAEVADFDGFKVSGDDIEVPDLKSLFTKKIAGRTTSDDCSITFYGDLTGNDITDVLARGDNGYVVWLNGGDVAANKMDVFPVRVKSTPRVRSISDAARVMVEFSVTGEPQENLAVPS